MYGVRSLKKLIIQLMRILLFTGVTQASVFPGIGVLVLLLGHDSRGEIVARANFSVEGHRTRSQWRVAKYPIA